MAGTLPAAGGAVKGEFRGHRSAGGAGPDRLVPSPWLPKHRIGDGEVIKDRFVRPRVGVVRRLTPGEVGRRPEAGRDGGQAQVVEDLPDHRWPLDHGNDLHPPAAACTAERIHLVDLADCCFR